MSICDLFGKDLEPKTVEFAHFADLEFSKNARLLKCTGFHQTYRFANFQNDPIKHTVQSQISSP